MKDSLFHLGAKNSFNKVISSSVSLHWEFNSPEFPCDTANGGERY